MANIPETQALLAAAMHRSGGLRDFGDASFRPALDMLVKSINEEGRLSEKGAEIFADRLVESLSSRLALEYNLKRYPAILAEELKDPIFIIGLPRTGTTMLHRVLARDSRFYTPMWWEVRFPVPIGPTAPDGEDPRIKLAKSEVKMMLDAMPELLTMHPLDAELPDEEVVLMEHSFLSAMYAYANVPTYTEWLGRQDQTPAYEYLKRQLQFLQWQKRQRGEVAQRWILKAPHHTHAMDVLFKVFRDAKIIQTHRDPLETIPSMSSFAYTIWRVYSDVADPRDAAMLWSTKFAKGLRDAIAVRDRMPADRFLDVWYLDAVAKPLEVAKAIYPFIGMSLTDEAEREMRSWVEHSSRDKRAPHAYSLEKMGLTEAQLKKDFAEYRERYILPRHG
ncbi:sulfotransferase family protein [Paraburkholderia sp. BL18I3N2]|uniref:sulfotransferase family protein n=1 Tax=Paraburkholderia sp. BL18I3N2 TaxID=1938799 RepID=UPI000D0583C3|nr:sulfotransferase [Paraburkholderia sp. BL18I3N2]PRX27331.1 sulfotransferase family protein [Paraburkholderia sp. BL18I3N2]